MDESLQRCGGAVTLVRSWHKGSLGVGLMPALDSRLEAGQAWKLSDQECDDLDLHAEPVGLLGLLNRCSTLLGEMRLKHWIEHPCLEPERIRARQEAVRWLDGHALQRLQAMAGMARLRNRDGSLARLAAALQQATPLRWPKMSLCLRGWSIVSFFVLSFGTIQVSLGRYGWLGILVLIGLMNTFIYLEIRRTLNTALQPWQGSRLAAEGYREAAAYAADNLPDATALATLRHHLAVVGDARILPSLCRRLKWTEAGGMIHALCNFLLFYDLHVIEAVLARAVPHQATLLDGLASLADLEAFCSLACFAYEQPIRTYPQAVDRAGLSITGGIHPLLEPQDAVPNDLLLEGQNRLWIVTGSNMAGKSTFLRMAGVNLLLAQCGTVACAREMTFSPVCLVTDLRIRDDLAKDESYFLAEIRQLRRMVKAPEDHHLLFGLIDEAFRGTNSQERVAASVALIEYLRESPHFFLVATHEQRLTELADDVRVKNVHFREDIAAGGTVFDYRLQPGPVQARNALRLMEQEGYPARLMERARLEVGSGAQGGAPGK